MLSQEEQPGKDKPFPVLLLKDVYRIRGFQNRYENGEIG